MEEKAVETRTWDASEHLESEEDMAAYLDAALEDGDATLVVAVLGDIARAKGMSQIAAKRAWDAKASTRLFPRLATRSSRRFSRWCGRSAYSSMFKRHTPERAYRSSPISTTRLWAWGAAQLAAISQEQKKDKTMINFNDSNLFTPITHAESGVTIHVLTRKVAPVQQGFYFVNDSMSADGRYLWFYCAFPPALHRTLAVIDFADQAVRHFPETNAAGAYVDPGSGDVFWSEGRQCGGGGRRWRLFRYVSINSPPRWSGDGASPAWPPI